MTDRLPLVSLAGALAAALALPACGPGVAATPAAPTPPTPPSQPPPPKEEIEVTPPNPLLEEWTTPFQVPPFERIQPAHYLPAFQAAIAAKRKEIAAITADPAAPTFANTIVALEDTGRLLDRVEAVFWGLDSAETSEALQAIAKEVTPALTALEDDVLLDEKLFSRVKAVWDARASLGLAPEQARLLEETHKAFVRGGANLDAAAKARLRDINKELSLLGLKFSDNVLAENNAYRLVVDKPEDLAGLPPSAVAAAADAARAAGLEGKWVFTLHWPSIWPFLASADNRELRRQLLTAYAERGAHGDERDNRAALARIAELRIERAKLLGHPTHAHFVLEENMAKTPEQVDALLRRLWKPALAVARKEARALQAAMRKDPRAGKGARLEAWDWRYYTEKVRKQRYDIDEEALRAYFELDRVRDGAFWLAGKLYGLKFNERTDIPKYHPEVRTFEVLDADGSHLGVFLVDYFPRPGKRQGAWCGGYRSQWKVNGERVAPIVVNVGNFSRPSGDTPALLTRDEVETLFHEFGHALHFLMSQVEYRSLRRVPRDFVELPSQIMENWALEPEVLAVYAKHWKTGEPIPAQLVAKLKKAEKFNQGFATVEYLAASFLDMAWHTLREPTRLDASAFEKQALADIGLMPEILVRYRSPYFAHIFGGGYSAGYYSYIWSEVLDADAYALFQQRGILDGATATSFRKNVLERGGTEDALELYRRFRGAEPSVEPLLERRGLK